MSPKSEYSEQRVPYVSRRAFVASTVMAAAPGLLLGAENTQGSREYLRKPRFTIEEYQLFVPGKKDIALDYYKRKVTPVLQTYPGYLGMSVLNPRPATSQFKNPRTAGYLGIPEDPIQPHEGVLMDGKVRTDRMIVFHSALRGSFDLIMRHDIADEETFLDVIQHNGIAKRWRDMYKTEFWDTLAQEYFIYLRNHYDVCYACDEAD